MQKNILKNLPQKFKKAFLTLTTLTVLAESIFLFPKSLFSQQNFGQITPPPISIYYNPNFKLFGSLSNPNYSFSLAPSDSMRIFSNNLLFGVQTPYPNISTNIYSSRFGEEAREELNEAVNPLRFITAGGKLTIIMLPVLDFRAYAPWLHGFGWQTSVLIYFSEYFIHTSYSFFEKNYGQNNVNLIPTHMLSVKVNL